MGIGNHIEKLFQIGEINGPVNIYVRDSFRINESLDYVKLEKWYSDFIGNKFQHLQILGMESPVKFEDVYVDVEISVLSSGKLKPISRNDFIKANNHLMVVGSAGIGKSLFLRKLAFDCLNGKLPYFPIPIKLTELSEGKDSIHDHLEGFFSFLLKENSEWYFRQLAIEGNLLLLLDGFDEVLNLRSGDAQQMTIASQIANLAATYPKCKIVLSGRGESSRKAPPGFQIGYMKGFTLEQSKSFIAKWTGLESSTEIQDLVMNYVTKNEVDEFELDEEDPDRFISEKTFMRVLELGIFTDSEEMRGTTSEEKFWVSNPLLLSYLCISKIRGTKSPANSFLLYESVIDLYLNDWNQTRTLQSSLGANVPAYFAVKVLERIAFTMLKEARASFNIQMVTDSIDSELDSAMGFIDSLEFSNHVCDQLNLVIHSNNRKYSFVHNLIQLHLATRYVIRTNAMSENESLIKLSDRNRLKLAKLQSDTADLTLLDSYEEEIGRILNHYPNIKSVIQENYSYFSENMSPPDATFAVYLTLYYLIKSDRVQYPLLSLDLLFGRLYECFYNPAFDCLRNGNFLLRQGDKRIPHLCELTENDSLKKIGINIAEFLDNDLPDYRTKVFTIEEHEALSNVIYCSSKYYFFLVAGELEADSLFIERFLASTDDSKHKVRSVLGADTIVNYLLDYQPETEATLKKIKEIKLSQCTSISHCFLLSLLANEKCFDLRKKIILSAKQVISEEANTDSRKKDSKDEQHKMEQVLLAFDAKLHLELFLNQNDRKSDTALQHIEKSCRLYSRIKMDEHPKDRTYYACAAKLKGDYDLSISLYKKAVKEDPSYFVGYLAIADIYLKDKKNEKKALEFWNKAKSSSSDFNLQVCQQSMEEYLLSPETKYIDFGQKWKGTYTYDNTIEYEEGESEFSFNIDTLRSFNGFRGIITETGLYTSSLLQCEAIGRAHGNGIWFTKTYREMEFERDNGQYRISRIAPVEIEYSGTFTSPYEASGTWLYKNEKGEFSTGRWKFFRPWADN